MRSRSPKTIPGPVSRLPGCTITLPGGTSGSCGSASSRWLRFTTTSVRSLGTSGTIRVSVASSRERSPVIRQYCFGIGAPAIFRVRTWRRLPSPPARTSAQGRSRGCSFEGSAPFNASIAGRGIGSTLHGGNRRAGTDGVGTAGGSPSDQGGERRAPPQARSWRRHVGRCRDVGVGVSHAAVGLGG